MSDNESKHHDLLERLRSGDTKAVSWLYDEYSAALYGVIYRIVRSHPKAESILEETFLKCLEDVHSQEQQLSLFTCMVRIARSIAQKHLLPKTENSERVNSEPQIFSDLGHLTLVEGLDTQYSEVLRLVYVEGQTLNQVAQLLNIPLESVRAQLRGALLHIHANLKKKSKIA